jgi:threonine dehydratase
MLADRRLTDTELLGDQHAADAVLDEVTVDLRAEMRPRALQPFQNQKPPVAGERAKNGLDVILQNETIMGQGTLGLELEQQAPSIDTLLVAVGGGGLIAGIAAWYSGRIKVVGVEPLASPTLTRAFEAGRPVDAEAGGLAADSLAPRRVGERVYPIVAKYARQTVLVTDDAIAKAQATLWRALRIVAEPGGAAAFAAILSEAYTPAAGERVAVIISGGNTSAVNFELPR